MHLKEFLKDLRVNAVAFEKYWQAMHYQQPEMFPLELEKGNEGLWWEMFNECDVSDYYVGTVDGWISLEDEQPNPGEMVVFQAKWVAFNGVQSYTSDPWCGWIENDGSFVRWPHEKFDPTHFKRI